MASENARPDLDAARVQRVIETLSQPDEHRWFFRHFDEITPEEAVNSLAALGPDVGKYEDFGPAANRMGAFLFDAIRRVLQRRAEGLPALPETDTELAASLKGQAAA